MIPILGSLALAGLAAATGIIEPRHEFLEARDAPSYVHPRDLLSSGAHPCRILSIMYEESGHKGGTPLWAAVPPSIGVECLKSVPYDKERDLALLDYLYPYVAQQSTLETLANPPEGYLLPGIDVLGGIEHIATGLKAESYANQYEVMTDLRRLFVAAADGHFEYPPALLSVFAFARRGLNFTSLSKDGVARPAIFMASEVELGNKGLLTYHPSAVKAVNDIPVFDFLEEEAMFYPGNHQDPDAQFNSLFASRHGSAAGKGEKLTYSVFEIPDTYTITFLNGSSLVVENEIVFYGNTDFSDIHSGEDVFTRFELPPTGKSKRSEAPSHEEYKKSLLKRASSGINGYPTPVAKHSMNSVAGYFPEGTDYEDVAVLSVLSFLPIGFDFNKASNFDLGEFVNEATDVIADFANAAKEQGRDKLILDLSSNGGGSVVLAQQIYHLLFPDSTHSGFGRWRATGALGAMAAADYDTLVSLMVTGTPFYPLGSDGNYIKTGKDWFGPYNVKGQNASAAYQDDLTKPWDEKDGFYYNGYDPKEAPVFKDAPFKPENIIVLTDGTCGSACTILTGLLTRNHGVRTVVTGGRYNNYPMQAMGGVKGTLLQINMNFLRNIMTLFQTVEDKNDKQAMSILEAADDYFPYFENPPLRPLPDSTAFGQFNARNGYSDDDLDGYALQFRYEAANCKLFYTQRMNFDVTETWRMVAKVGWGGASCVVGSTTNQDGTIGDTAPAYDKSVLSRFGWS